MANHRRGDDNRWRGRPGQARALRIAVVVAPIAVSLLVAAAASKLIPRTASGPMAYARVALVVVIAMLSAAVAERLARKLLPLSVLLELSMLFPDRAPSRLAIARRARHGAISPEDLLSSRDEDAAGAAVRILALMSALAAHDRRTRGHAERVRAFTDLLAARMDLPKADRDKLRWAALLHDIGKLDVSPALLNKPSGLNRDEWSVMRRHPLEGAKLAGPLMPWLGEWGKAILEHHERYDGTGYPLGLAAANISLAGRIVGVVDAYETMTAARAYKKALATREARAELARCAGTQFDPACVRAFLAISLPRLLWASGPLSFVVQLPFLRFIQDAGLRVATVSTSVVSTTTAIAGAAVLVIPSVAAAGVVQRSPRVQAESNQSSAKAPAKRAPVVTPPKKVAEGTTTASPSRKPSSPTASSAPAPTTATHREAAAAAGPTGDGATQHVELAPAPTPSASAEPRSATVSPIPSTSAEPSPSPTPSSDRSISSSPTPSPSPSGSTVGKAKPEKPKPTK